MPKADDRRALEHLGLSWRKAALALVAGGVAAIQFHPWGLLALFAGLALWLSQGWALGQAGDSLRVTGSRAAWTLYGAGLAVTALGGAGLAWLFSSQDALASEPEDLWLYAAEFAVLASAGAFMASLALAVEALPLEPPPPRRRKKREEGPWVFWGACALVAVLLRLSEPWLAALALPLVLAKAPSLSPAALREEGSEGPWRWACAAIIAAGFGLHLWGLETLPQGLNGEEAYTLSLARSIVDGKPLAFMATETGGFTGPTLYQHVVGWLYLLPGTEGLATPLRLISVLGWLVLAAYATAFMGSAFSWCAAAGTAAYLSFAFFPLHYGRMGFYFVWAPAVGAAVLAHAHWSLRSRWANGHLGLAGAWCALGAFGWTAGFVSPGLGAAVLLGALGLNLGHWRSRWPGLLLGGTLFLALAAPALQGFIHYPGGLSHYSEGASGSFISADAHAGVTLSSNLTLNLKELLVTGSSRLDRGLPGRAAHYLPGIPVMRWPLLIPALAGLAVILGSAQGPGPIAVLASLVLGFLPGWLSNPEGRNLGRLVMLMIPFGALVGWGWSLLLAQIQTLPWPRPSARQALAAATVFLAVALGSELFLYFKAYRDDLEAITENYGASAELARSVKASLSPVEDLYFTERFTEARVLLHLLPRRAEQILLREVPDLAAIMARSKEGTLLSGNLVKDWQPWLKDNLGPVEFAPVANPWGDLGFENEPHFRRLKRRYLGGILQWDRPFVPGLRRISPQRWTGYLWVARPGDYQLSVKDGRLLKLGHLELSAATNPRVRLQAVPYAVVVEGGLLAPRLTAAVEGVQAGREWREPVFPTVSLHGLRKTLRNKGAAPSDPNWISLRPVVAQHFDVWSRQEGISPVHFPLTAHWEGALRAPRDGLYRFLVLNNLDGMVTISIDGQDYFRSRGGAIELTQPVALKSGQPHVLVLTADPLNAGESLRFVYETTGRDGPEVVPYQWLDPAPLPPPMALP